MKANGDGRLRLSDLEARVKAQLELERPVAVEAGAGTGKTSVLVARVLAWCLGPGWEEAAIRSSRGGHEPAPLQIAAETIEGVVAITFTEAAAAEMEQRVAGALARIQRGEPVPGFELHVPPGDAADRAGALLSVLHRFPVSTIHGFSSRLLASYPVQAAVAPGFVIDADGLAVSEEVRAVVEETMGRMGALEDVPQAWRTLAASGFGPGSMIAALELLVNEEVPPDVLARDPFASKSAGEILSDVHQTAVRLASMVRQGLGPDGAAKGLVRHVPPALERLATRLAPDQHAGPTYRFSVLAKEAKAVPRNLLGQMKRWSKGVFTKREALAFTDIGGEIMAAAGRMVELLSMARSTDPDLLYAGYRALRPLLETVRMRLRSKGIMTYRGLLTGAASLLANTEIAGEVRRSIRQLLVDEFQDTDAVGCEIIRRLALEGPRGERPGLFIVGDPKQSIYGWRSADLEAYEAFLGEMRRAGGIELHLMVNFRSVEPVLAEVTRAVGPVMQPQPGLQPDFQPLLASGERAGTPVPLPGGRATVEYWVSRGVDSLNGRLDERSTRVADQRQIEARALAADLRQLHDGADVAWGEIGVLFRTLSSAEPYLEALRNHRIPYAVAKERMYFRRREIVDMAALVRAILDPADTMALLTVLRSDNVGIPDAALPALWEGGLPDLMLELDGPDPAKLDELKRLIERVAGRLAGGVPGLEVLPDWPAAMFEAVETLAILRVSWASDPAPLFVERLRTLWGAEAVAASRTLGRFRLQLLGRFFDDLLDVLTQAGGRTAEVTRFLRRAAARERELERSPVAEGGDAVQVMTIHGAKGLEFEHVYIVDMMHRTRQNMPPQHAVLSGRTGPALRLFGSTSPDYLLASRRARKVAQVEQVRLLYVAMTRAKRRLVLAGGWTSLKKRQEGAAADLLGLLRHRADALGLETAASAGEERVRREEEDVVIWFPALSEAGTGGATPPDERVWDGSGKLLRDRIEADERTLAVARLQAARIEDMPFVRTPTALAHPDPELEEAEATPPASSHVDRVIARTVGTALHRSLEQVDLGNRLPPTTERIRMLAETELKKYGGGAVQAAALQRLGRIVESLGRGVCLGRLGEIAPHVVARELPVLLVPDVASDVPGFVSGFADLVYRDPAGGRLVVADYKTDVIPDRGTREKLVERYAKQVAVYVRALAEAFPFEPRPRAELWFLAQDLIVPIPEEGRS